jgi:LPS sulfotransferase NodH
MHPNRDSLSCNLMPTHPRRFIILASQRTGSNLLRSLLGSHPAVVAYGEIYLRDHSWFESELGPKDCPELVAERDADPIAFAEKYVFRSHDASIKAVGFKLFYQHAKEYDHALWRWLDQMPDLMVIHLRRQNLLKQFVSAEVAKATNVWRSNYTKEARMSHDEVALELDLQECERFMRSTRDAAEAACERLSHRQRLDLNYEDMTSSIDASMHRTLEFLNLEPRPLESQLRKQINRPLQQLVKNYDALCTALAGSEWASCLDG